MQWNFISCCAINLKDIHVNTDAEYFMPEDYSFK